MSLSLIEKKLAQLRGHIRLMFLSWGLAKLLIWAAGLTLWLYYTDLVLKLPGGMRVGFLVLSLLILAVIAIRNLVYPLSRTLSDEDLALLVEREYPLLNDRLITSLQLLKSQEKYKDAASGDMMRAVVSESFDIAGKLQFNEAVRSRRLLYMVTGSVLAMAIVFGHAVFARGDMSTWVRRALGGGPEWPTNTQLEVMILARDQLPQYPTTEELNVNFTFDPEASIPELRATGIYEVAAGSDLRIIARPSGEDPVEAEIRIVSFQRDPETGRYVQVGSPVSRPMERAAMVGGDGEQIFFSYNKLSIINPVEQITIRAGDATAGPYTVRVIPPPEITSSIEISYVYPEYLVLPERTTNEPAIDAVAGTHVRVKFTTSKPLQLEGPEASALLVDFNVGSSQRYLLDTDQASGENAYSVRIPGLQLGMSRWRLKLVDRQGIENGQRIGDLMQVKEDTAPTVRVLFSGDPLVSNQFVYVTEDAVIPLEFDLRDDYGVGSARMFWRYSIDNEFTEYKPFAEGFKHLASKPEREVKGAFELEFSKLLAGTLPPAGTRASVELYIQAFDLNQVKPEDGSPPVFQGSKHNTTMTYELTDVDELRAKVSSQIRQIKTTINAMLTNQAELLQISLDALEQPGLLDFRNEKGEALRKDLNDAYRRQNQLLRDAEVVLSRFGVFAQVYQFNRLEREDLARPQESRIQTVRLLLAVASADRDLQQAINNPLVRLEEAEDDTIRTLAHEVISNLRRSLLRALPEPGFSADSFGKLIQENRVYTPGCLERGRGIYENVLEVGIKPNERRELLSELTKQQELTVSVLRAVQEQVKKWEGYDDILQGFRNLLKNQKDTNEGVTDEARDGD
ncbi:MAG: hypothetical protein IPK87_09380 [Planctomycetes bacterium]|nr:hypothetical protein [Planctomycetota bacterium]